MELAAVSQDSDGGLKKARSSRKRAAFSADVNPKQVGCSTALPSSCSAAQPSRSASEGCLQVPPAKRPSEDKEHPPVKNLRKDQDAESGSITSIDIRTFKFRCSPHIMVNDVYPLLTQDQIIMIKKTKLRSTLRLKVTKPLGTNLVKWLVERVNPKAGTLLIGTKPILIKPLVLKVMGLPNEGREIPVVPFCNGKNTSKGKSILGKGKSARRDTYSLSSKDSTGAKRGTPAYEFKSGLTGADKEKTLKTFMYVKLCYLVAPNTSLNIDKRFSDILDRVNRLGGWNWSRFMFELLMKGIDDIQRSKSSCVCGNVYLLVVIFLDLVAPPELNIPTGYPRIRHIRDKHLQWLKVKKGAWDNLEVKDLDDSVYSDDYKEDDGEDDEEQDMEGNDEQDDDNEEDDVDGEHDDEEDDGQDHEGQTCLHEANGDESNLNHSGGDVSDTSLLNKHNSRAA